MEAITRLISEVMPVFEDWLRETVREEMIKTLDADRQKAKPERMLTRDEVCKLLHISKPTLWLKTKEGEIDCVKVGRRVLYKEGTIKKWLMED